MHIDFPLDIDIFDTTEETTRGLFRRLSKFGRSIVRLTGQTKSKAYADQLFAESVTAPVCSISLADNDVSGVYSVERDIRSIAPQLIVAIGGGKVADFGKRLAYIANIPLLLVPTIIANDGLISPVAVLQDGTASVSMPGRMPDTVLIDMEVIKSAPVRYLRSAACDLITNLSATNDWERASAGDTGRMDHLALQMSRMAAHQVLSCRDWNSESPMFLRTILYGQMLSGISMAIAGSSRPCSGSEHLIAHALDARKLGVDTLHGEKVGVASRFCLHLQQFQDERLEAFFDAFNVPKTLPGCGSLSTPEMAEIFALARTMRPGRATILDSFSDTALSECYSSYLQTGAA